MATADTSIYNQVGRASRIQTPFETQNQLSAVLQGVNQNRMAEMKMQQAQADQAKQNRLSALLAPEYATPEAKYTALSRGGFQKEADDFRTGEQTYQKGKVDIDKSAFALANDKYNKYKSVIGTLSQRPDLSKDMVVQAGQEMVNAGLLAPDMFQKSMENMPDDPNQLRLKLREGVMSQMTPEQQLTFFNPKAEKIDNGQTIGFRDMNPNSPTYGQQTGGAAVQREMTPGEVSSAATARRGQDITVRGQNMTDSRSRESNNNALTKPFEITGEDGKPVLVQQDKQGNIRPVSGYGPKQGASKPLTEGQSKALLFGSRMQESNDIINELAEKGSNVSVPGSRTGYGVGTVVNAIQPADRQRLDQAKRNFLNAVLRRESGAVIAKEEFDSGDRQYFPQPGEGPDVIAQKRAGRETAMRGIIAEVPDAENRIKQVRGGSSPKTPTSSASALSAEEAAELADLRKRLGK